MGRHPAHLVPQGTVPECLCGDIVHDDRLLLVWRKALLYWVNHSLQTPNTGCRFCCKTASRCLTVASIADAFSNDGGDVIALFPNVPHDCQV